MNSYYVEFTGNITIRKTKQYNEDEFVKKLDNIFGEGDMFFDIMDETDDEVSFWFNGYKTCFREDEVVDFLTGIADITLEGEIEYRGDDNDLWRYTWNDTEHAWVQQAGYVCYCSDYKKLERRA